MRRSITMTIAAALALAGMGAVGFDASMAAPKQRSDQGEARKEMRAGKVLSLRQIEARILPRMKGSEYLGPAYDSTARAYRLKFIRNGRVTYIDVDAKTGRIINQSR